MTSIFDEMLQAHNAPGSVEAEPSGSAAPLQASGVVATASPLKNAVQELLKYGLLEAERKPNLYQIAQTQQEAVNRILEPLDLHLKIDSVRGLAFIVVAQLAGADGKNPDAMGDDEWSHPLVRRQRFTLEQSLLVAILRQLFALHEQEKGVGAGAVIVALEDLLPHVQLYLGDLGSDAREQKRLRNLLDNLKPHGIVSEVDEKDQFTVRPIITHLADPQSLKNLLLYFREHAGQQTTVSTQETGDSE